MTAMVIKMAAITVPTIMPIYGPGIWELTSLSSFCWLELFIVVLSGAGDVDFKHPKLFLVGLVEVRLVNVFVVPMAITSGEVGQQSMTGSPSVYINTLGMWSLPHVTTTLDEDGNLLGQLIIIFIVQEAFGQLDASSLVQYTFILEYLQRKNVSLL